MSVMYAHTLETENLWVRVCGFGINHQGADDLSVNMWPASHLSDRLGMSRCPSLNVGAKRTGLLAKAA